MKALFDLGNTRVKWALFDGMELRPGGALPHGGNVDFVSLLKDIPDVAEIWAASVAAPGLDAALSEAAQSRWGAPARFVRSTAQACGVRNAYAQPQRLGVDRWLALIATHAHGAVPAVIASCGTALTLDALAADGTHLGGLIAPSPDVMRAALVGNTARLGDLDGAAVVEIADNTADAVASGTWLAAAALVERFVAQAARRLGASPALILSGGGAGRLGGLLAVPHRIDAELVLRGLAHYADNAVAVG